mmetsp:Transcript_57341/g.83829  ORF Transcript_57341/g.83829 Transcript_57341/m.83829 type:complete len:228 (+) Transcript_57341:138-821(+)
MQAARFFALIALILVGSLNAFVVPARSSGVASKMQLAMTAEGAMGRREVLAAAAAAVATATVPIVAFAEPEQVERATSRMGGTMDPYNDVNKGFKLMRPGGWDAFSNAPGEYDVKFVDLVNKAETITVSTTPVKSSTSIDALGEVGAVGAKLAASRGAELLSANDKITENIRAYTFEFKKGSSYEIYQLSINKGRLWSLSCVAPSEKSWAKRKEAYRVVAGSFLPRL